MSSTTPCERQSGSNGQAYQFEMEMPTITFITFSHEDDKETSYTIDLIEAQLLIEECMKETDDINQYWARLKDRLSEEMNVKLETKGQVWQLVTVTYTLYSEFKKKFNHRLRQLTASSSTPSE